jgi:hypothetical protein
VNRRIFLLAFSTSAAFLAPRSPFANMDTSELISKGWSKSELAKILADFDSKYRRRLNGGLRYRINDMGPDEFDVHFPNGLPPPFLAWLVNYVQYPEGFALDRRSISVLGRVTLTSAYPLPSTDYMGARARIYVPSNDRDFDLVYVAVDSKFFRQSFTDDKWKPEEDGRVPEGVKALW